MTSGFVWGGLILSMNVMVGNSITSAIHSLLSPLLVPIVLITPYWASVFYGMTAEIQSYLLIGGIASIIFFGGLRLWLNMKENMSR